VLLFNLKNIHVHLLRKTECKKIQRRGTIYEVPAQDLAHFVPVHRTPYLTITTFYNSLPSGDILFYC